MDLGSRYRYLRHELTNFDARLTEQKGKVGVGEAAEIIQGRVYAKIGEVYQDLMEKCDRQCEEAARYD